MLPAMTSFKVFSGFVLRCCCWGGASTAGLLEVPASWPACLTCDKKIRQEY